jgi:Na+/H+ antiporter NhaC
MNQKNNGSRPTRPLRDPNIINFEIVSERNGNKRRTNVKIDPEDVLAAGGVMVALVFAWAMVSGSVPINRYTVAIVTLSGCGTAVAKIVKGRIRKRNISWIPYAIIAALLLAFGAYVWATAG